MEYTYTNPDPLSLAGLKNEIETALTGRTVLHLTSADLLRVEINATLSAPEVTALDSVVAAHSGGGDKTQPIQMTQTLAADDLSLRAQGDMFTVTAGQTSDHRFTCALAYGLNGGSVFTQYGALGDTLTVDIIDTRGHLGYGNDFVLPGSEFIKNWMVYPGIKMEIVDLSVSWLPIADLDVRFRYTSTGVSDVTVGTNLRLYEKI